MTLRNQNPALRKYALGFQDLQYQPVSSSSSCHAASTDIPDTLSPLLPTVHRFWHVLRATPVSSQNCCMYVRAGRPAFARPYEGVH